jgi:hypothetical protein
MLSSSSEFTGVDWLDDCEEETWLETIEFPKSALMSGLEAENPLL